MKGVILSNPKAPGKPDPNALIEACPIGGITPFTAIDFPGRLAAVLYTQGCIWRCRYCHNASLRPFERGTGPVTADKLLCFLEERQGLLDGIVFSGGEPTHHAGLGDLMAWVKSLGFKVALHTSGMFPDALRRVVPSCDWVGMDVKAPFDRYETVTQMEGSGEDIDESIRIVVESGVDYEFRTTVHPELLNESDILEIAERLVRLGARNYVLQLFRTHGCPDDRLNRMAPAGALISRPLHRQLSRMFPDFFVRS